MFSAGLKALKPFVRPVMKREVVASAAERTEYALALRHLGAQREAEMLLSAPDLESFPQAVLARGFVKMHQWNYLAALSHIEHYLTIKEIGDYERFVARVNQLACFNFLGRPEFASSFHDLKAELAGAGHSLLLANALEIFAQHLASQEAWGESRATLLEAKALIDAESGRSSLYIDKWLSLQKAFERKSAADILVFREKALALRDWETLRDLDYNLAKLEPNSFWAEQVYFGSPYPSFRARVLSIRPFASESWLSIGKNPSVKLDPWFPPQIEDSLTHRFLVCMLTDLYKPQTIGSLFSGLYLNEYFDLDIASKRIRQLMKRLRKWLAANELPLNLISDRGLYSLRMGPGVSVLMRDRALEVDSARFYLSRYQKSESQTLSSDQWAKVIGLSKVNTLKKLREGEAAGLVTRVGNSRYLMFKLKEFKPFELQFTAKDSNTLRSKY